MKVKTCMKSGDDQSFIYMYMYINISRATSWTRRSFDATEVKVELHEIKWIKIIA